MIKIISYYENLSNMCILCDAYLLTYIYLLHDFMFYWEWLVRI